MNEKTVELSSVARRAWFGRVYERGIVGRNRYALTFDDGPMEGATREILDILKSRRAPAAFFVIGENARSRPGLVERMADEGHLVGNHTWSHSHYSMLRGPWYWRREIDDTDAVIRSVIGRTPRLFRPPMAVRTPVNMGVLRRTGHDCVMWTRRAMDGIVTTRQRIVDRLSHQAADGAVLLLHDGREAGSDRNPRMTIEALPDVMDAMESIGLKPAPLDELLGIRAYDNPC